MPGYDGTGPRGRGPMTGAGRGYCVLELGETGDTLARFVRWDGRRSTEASLPECREGIVPVEKAVQHEETERGESHADL